MPYGVIYLLSIVIQGLILLIVLDIIISWAIQFGAKISPYHPVVRTIHRVTEPLLTPIRRILPPPWKTGGWDFAPMVACLLLQLLGGLIWTLH